MREFVAVDFGTCNSAVAYYGPRGPEVIKVDGAELVPSAVMAVPRQGEGDKWELVVGQKALRARERSPRSPFCYTSFKRQLGAVYNPEEATTGQMVPGPRGMLHFQGPDGVTYSPEHLASLVLDRCISAAEAKLGKQIFCAIICVPATYNQAQRNAIREAARLAGLEEVELMDEPVAAAIAHGHHADNDRPSRVFVLDVGAGTTDCALIEIGRGLMRVLATNGAAMVGGDDWDRCIRNYVVNLHQVQNERSTLAANPDAMRLLLVEAERAKRRLSDEEATEFRVEDIGVDTSTSEDIHVIQTISRDHMDEVTGDLLQDIAEAIQRTMDEAREKDPRFTIRDVDDIILVGGQTRVKAIQRKVAHYFGKAPRSDVDPELAVVLGAAIQAGIREGRLASITIRNITAHGYSVETHDKAEDVATEIVRKGTPYGTKATWWLSNRDPNQRLMSLKLLQGDGKRPADNIVVWERQIEVEPGEPRSARVQMDIEIGPSGEPVVDIIADGEVIASYGRAA